MVLISRTAHAVQPVVPTAIYPYFDKLQLWLPQPLPKTELKRLRSYCGNLHDWNKPAGFNPSFRQRLQLNQPKPDALRMLANLSGLHLNYLEVALDWIFDNEFECAEAFDFLGRYHVKKYHRNQGIRYVEGTTRYTGPRGAPNMLAIYNDRHCKLTGEVFCCHLDWRICGNAALERAGIATVADLVDLDHREFWRQRLLLYAVNLRDLGRRHFNHVNGTKRRQNWSILYGSSLLYDFDKATGAMVCNYFDGKTQNVLDHFGSSTFRDSLIPLDVNHLLPPILLYDICEQMGLTPNPALISNTSSLKRPPNQRIRPISVLVPPPSPS
jgi:hypothetical protein